MVLLLSNQTFHCLDNITCYHYYSLYIANCYTPLGCYIHNVSATVLTNILQVPFVVFGNLLGIMNLTLYLNHRIDCFYDLWISCISHFLFFLPLLEPGSRIESTISRGVFDLNCYSYF